MASRRLTGICYLCQAARATRPRAAVPILRSNPAGRRFVSSLTSGFPHQPALTANGVNFKSRTATTTLQAHLTRTTVRHYVKDSERGTKQAPGPSVSDSTYDVLEISPASKSAYGPSDTASLEKLMGAIDGQIFAKSAEVLPSEDQVIDALGALQRFAINQTSTASSKLSTAEVSSAQAILSIANEVSKPEHSLGTSTDAVAPSTAENKSSSSKKAGRSSGVSASTRAQIEAHENPPIHPVMDVAYNIVSHPSVFISPAILRSYVLLSATVRDPSTLPHTFRKYASKPILSSPGGQPKKPNPNAAKYAIPLDIAKSALDVSIAAKNLPKALEIIETSVAAKAFLRRKTMTQVIPFWTLCGVLPVGLWRVASWLATFDTNFLHSTATGWAFTLLCCYTVYTGTIGLTALLTYNDHMLRVTWIPGYPLRNRWYLEDQRKMADKVAMAWGFQNPQEWGLESGWEWAYLRHWCGVRGMIVDDSTVLETKEIRLSGH